MFHYDQGIFLTDCGLALDVRRRQRRGFISHAHVDHMAPHETAYCTPTTAEFYRHRMEKKRPRRVVPMPFGRPIELNDIRLTTWPAGHVLGSAMLLAERDGQRLLYTGDFRLGPSATAERCELPRADVLITESTFGSPRYRLPPHPEAAETLIDLVRGILAGGRTPVVFAYVLGKAQEVTKILTGAGIPVVQHPAIFEISKIYERVGCPLGALSLWEDQCPAGSVLIVPPMGQRGRRIELFAGKVTIGVTGWGIDPSAKYRFGLDHVVPLSDHCDFDQLLRAIEQVGPRVIYVTHGPVGFTDRLRALGLDARPIDGPIQHRLF